MRVLTETGRSGHWRREISLILKSKRAIAAALATMAIMLAGSFFAAGSASAAQGTKVTVAASLAKTVMYHNCDPIIILDRLPCLGG